jgi:hypothetical protein
MKKKKPLQCAFSTEEAFKTNGVCPHEQTLFEKSLIAHVRCVKPIFHSFRLFYPAKLHPLWQINLADEMFFVRIIWHAACTLVNQQKLRHIGIRRFLRKG